ncbi:MAG: hypothetical protein IKH45_05000, partial [Neisseriaceae bacterium]|nr:hypothetical protein [Neisseriaceae bacterium]
PYFTKFIATQKSLKKGAANLFLKVIFKYHNKTISYKTIIIPLDFILEYTKITKLNNEQKNICF